MSVPGNVVCVVCAGKRVGAGWLVRRDENAHLLALVVCSPDSEGALSRTWVEDSV